ncbi:MAG TPA: glycosyltransferase family 2 protein [Thermomicrobiales bacterium]|nr:glycosyltransferase family 2 protein [Thermomicrobiales bacterium]
MSKPVTVIIVNYNGGRLLLDCLGALQRQSLGHAVVVVDNRSTDGSAQVAHDEYPEARLLPLRHNVGFARAVNIAASRLCDSNGIVVTLNPDAVPEPEFLEQLLRPFETDPSVGAAAGTLVFASNRSIIASSGIVVHRNGVALDARLGEQWAPGSSRPVFGASAGAAAYRVRALRDAGWFPDQFFLYLEDVDLAWRLRLRGWQTVSVPDAVATHAYSASAVEGSPLKRRLLARNRVWTLARCLPTECWKRDRLHIVGFDTVAVGHAVVNADLAALRGRSEGFAGLPLRLHERRFVQSRARVNAHAIEPWILPPVSLTRLLRLRQLTAELSLGVRG